MAEAKLSRIVPDPTLAGAFLTRAEEFLADGSSANNTDSSRQVLLHNAAIAACDAVLAIKGFEVEGSERSHVLRLDQAQELLGHDLIDLFERLGSVRLTRADVSYAAGFVGGDEVGEAETAVGELVAHARDFVRLESAE